MAISATQSPALTTACLLLRPMVYGDWARDVAQLKTLVSYVDPANTRSCRLAERLGAVPDNHAKRQDPDGIVYRHFD